MVGNKPGKKRGPNVLSGSGGTQPAADDIQKKLDIVEGKLVLAEGKVDVAGKELEEAKQALEDAKDAKKPNDQVEKLENDVKELQNNLNILTKDKTSLQDQMTSLQDQMKSLQDEKNILLETQRDSAARKAKRDDTEAIKKTLQDILLETQRDSAARKAKRDDTEAIKKVFGDWKAPTKLIPGEILKLPEGVAELYGDADLPEKIFIREEYVRLFNMWESSTKGFILIGSAGIGKSAFGLLVFCILIGRKENVKLTYGRDIEETRFKGEGDKTVAIHDSREGFHMLVHRVRYAKVLIIHSPSGHITNSKKYSSEVGVEVMKVFELDEALNCIDKCVLPKKKTQEEKKMTKDRAREHFIYTGGSLRNMMDPDAKNMIDAGITTLKNQLPLEKLGHPIRGDGKEVSHRVLHVVGFETYEFASRYVWDRYFWEVCLQNEKLLLHMINDKEIHGGLRGDAFEQEIFYTFQKFKAFKFDSKVLSENLQNSPKFPRDDITDTVDFTKTAFRTFDVLQLQEDVESEAKLGIAKEDLVSGAIFCPTFRTLKAIDLFALMNFGTLLYLVLFQLTVSQSHSVKLPGLQAVEALLEKAGKEVSGTLLVFLVPPSTFAETFNIQLIKYKNGGSVVENTKNKYPQLLWNLSKRQGEGEEEEMWTKRR